nr:MAG TPA: hypothetical protein [Caudoviricetes sp.]
MYSQRTERAEARNGDGSKAGGRCGRRCIW